jgi:hypothetical protein
VIPDSSRGGAVRLRRDLATRIDHDARRVRTAGGKCLEYNPLMPATGALRIRWELRDDLRHAFVTLGRAVICWRRLRTACR